WGENWLGPIQGRLLQLHGYLRSEELDDLAAACQEAMKFGHETAYGMVRESGTDISQDGFTSLVLAKHPWISAANAARLFNQSMYYAWKTGGPPRRA
ncbi:MAG: hypothetical protein JWQ76_1263, partial [Ramlibacter sp.]|nr:hypothetical protein [Ramlibacter sp.]